MFLKRGRGLSLHTGKNFNFNTHRCENLTFYSPLSIIQLNYYTDTYARPAFIKLCQNTTRFSSYQYRHVGRKGWTVLHLQVPSRPWQ